MDLAIIPINMAINIVALLFLDFLAVVYLTKKNIGNIENKVYKQILLWNFVDLHVHFSYLFVAYFFHRVDIYAFLMLAHLATLLFYFFFVSLYILVVSKEKNAEEMKKLELKINRYSKYIPLLFVIIFIIQVTLPCEVTYIPGGFYTIGLATYYWYIVIAIYLVFDIYILVHNRKTYDIKKVIPFLILLALAFIDGIISILFPAICPIVVIVTLITYLMYHTIENPDLKLINQLELAKNQAEKSNEAKTDFLSSMSHEIRTPLNAIVGLSQMIKESSEIDNIHKDSDDILIASENLLEIVNGILDINKLEANKMEIIETEYNPREIIDSIIKLINIKIGSKQLSLRADISEMLPNILYGDKDKIKQIIMNLLTNAVKYTESGFVEFKIDCKNNKDKCELTITVKDTGRGISDEQKENLFTKFNRLEKDKDSDIEGTGLGLAITKSLVELFNGTISVDSVLGRGSTFTVVVNQKIIEEAKKMEEQTEVVAPSTEYRQEVVSEPVNTQEVQVVNTVVTQDSNNKKVLIVDDNKINLKVAAKMLGEFNFDIETANSGYECLDMANTNNYMLVFMDIMMPGMDGVETMKKLKEKENFQTPVIALTADAMNGSREKYLADGFDEYISKPINREVLSTTITKFIDLNNLNSNEIDTSAVEEIL